MQFTSAFAITGTINLPVLFGCLLLIAGILNLFITNKISNEIFCLEHNLILLFLFFVLLSFIINGLGYNSAINHTAAYFSSFLLFFTAPFLYFFQNENYKNQIFTVTLKAIFYCVTFSSIFSVIEFVFTNFLNISVTDFIPRHSVKEYDPLIVGFLIRSRGFAEESGHYSFMIEILGPLAIYYMFYSNYCKLKKIIKIIVTFLIVLSVLTSFSVSSFLIIPLTILVALILKFKQLIIIFRKNMLYIIGTIGTIVVMYYIINLLIPINEIISITISQKFDSFSFDDRKFRTTFFQNTFFKLPLENILIGNGPSGVKLLGYDDSYTFLSLYQTLTFEIGVIGLLIVGVNILIILMKNFLSNNPIASYFFVSILSGLIHYNSISNYWYPFLWFILAFCIFCYKSFDVANES